MDVGAGLQELTWTFRPGATQHMSPASATIRWDGTGTLDKGGGPRPVTLGPIAMAELERALAASRAHANATFGDACEGCSYATVNVTPAKGGAWSLTVHGDAGPEPVRRVFAGLLSALRP